MIDGTKIRATRDAQNISREALGRTTGLSVQTILRIENGEIKNPGIETLMLITKALLLDLDDVIVNVEDAS